MMGHFYYWVFGKFHLIFGRRMSSIRSISRPCRPWNTFHERKKNQEPGVARKKNSTCFSLLYELAPLLGGLELGTKDQRTSHMIFNISYVWCYYMLLYISPIGKTMEIRAKRLTDSRLSFLFRPLQSPRRWASEDHFRPENFPFAYLEFVKMDCPWTKPLQLD